MKNIHELASYPKKNNKQKSKSLAHMLAPISKLLYS